MKLAIIISIILAIGSVLSPVWVALINNSNQRKLRQLELNHDMSMKKLTIFYEDKKNAFTSFLTAAGKVCTDEALYEVEQDFYAFAQLAALFETDENQKLISEFTSDIMRYLDKGMKPNDCDMFKDDLSKITSALNKELASLKEEIYQQDNDGIHSTAP